MATLRAGISGTPIVWTSNQFVSFPSFLCCPFRPVFRRAIHDPAEYQFFGQVDDSKYVGFEAGLKGRALCFHRKRPQIGSVFCF